MQCKIHLVFKTFSIMNHLIKNIHPLIVLGLVFNFFYTGYSQEASKLCICFTEKTEFIEVKSNHDSTKTNFSIIQKGFESEEKRKKVIEEYRKRPPTMPPDFTIDYFATEKPKKISSIGNVDCALILSVKEFRLKEVGYPDDVRDSNVFFLKKIADNEYLKWEAVIAIEL